MKKIFLLFSVTFFAQITLAENLDLTFNMDQYDNDKHNGLKEKWILKCSNDGQCTLSQIAFLCSNKQDMTESTIHLDIYTTTPNEQIAPLREFNLNSEKQKISFMFNQNFGPKKILCKIDYENSVKVSKAYCSGNGVWSAGTKYNREWRLNSKKYYLDDFCKKIKMPN